MKGVRHLLQGSEGDEAKISGSLLASCRDYSNGGPSFLRDEGSKENNVEELAWYKDGIDGAAAVKCKVTHAPSILTPTSMKAHHCEIGTDQILAISHIIIHRSQ